jgi:hypothetical protein
VVIRQKDITARDVLAYVLQQAKEARIPTVEGLQEPVGSRTFTSHDELDTLYEYWYDQLFCKEEFPQYLDLPTPEEENKTVKPTARELLSSLIGLSSVKQLGDTIIDTNKAQHAYASFGVKSPHRHGTWCLPETTERQGSPWSGCSPRSGRRKGG